MRTRMRNIRVFRISNDACRFECEIGADQQRPLLAFLEKLVGHDIAAELSRWSDKRSLDANSYAWKLMSMIADVLTLSGATTTKDEIYHKMLRMYGQGDIVKVRPDKAELILREFPYKEPHEKLYTDQDQYWRVWVGSSNYNTREMAAFIDGVIEDAKELGIETLPPRELERMMNQWQRASCKPNVNQSSPAERTT